MRNKIYFLAILVFSLGFLGSCSSDDDNGGGASSDLIVGKWEHKSQTITINGQGVPIPYEHECATKKDFIEFLSTNKMEETNYGSDCTVEYFDQGSTYEISGNILKVYTEGETVPEEAEILELNNSKLRIMVQAEEGMNFELIAEFSRM